MKKLITGMLALTLGLASANVLAATTTATTIQPTVAVATSTRVGVLDMRQVMEKSTQIAQIREKLQKDFQPKQKKLVAAQTTLKNDAERLRRDNAIMNNNDRKVLEQKIIVEQKELQRLQAAYQQEAMAEQNKALKGFLDNVRVVVDRVAKADNLSIVITKDTVAYVNPSFDITSKVVQQLPHK